jgi:uncharacterized protein YfaT (DUF1175 family)
MAWQMNTKDGQIIWFQHSQLYRKHLLVWLGRWVASQNVYAV